ncbi:MAG: cytochrome C [Gammaproteobacteria bacterium]|nr:cytochrome C [Gammaproteobacteria bacterium]
MSLNAPKWIFTAASLICIALFSSAASAALTPKLQEIAKNGKHIFTHPTFGGNGKSCESCHSGGGLEIGHLPNGKEVPSLRNAAAIFPRFNRRDQLVTLQDQIRNCVGGAIEGTPPAYDSEEMRTLVVYLTSLSQGKAIDMGGKPQ